MARRVPFVPQMEVADCGAACLAMVLGYHGKRVPLSEIRENTGSGRDGIDALRLVQAARGYGLEARGVRVEIDQLHLLPAGAILHWGFNHFIVFERVRRARVEVVDPAAGRRSIPLSQFRNLFTGIAITAAPGANFQTGAAATRGTWRYLRPMLSQGRLLRRILVTSLLIRLFALAIPILTASLIDRVVLTGDGTLLPILVGAALAMVVYHLLTSFLRAHLLLNLRTHLDINLTLGFVNHLIDLPYAFFLRRSAGDLMMRLRSNAIVRELLTVGSMTVLLDGLMTGLYLILLLALSWQMGLLVLGLGGLQVLVLLLARRRTQQLMSESLEIEARSQSYLYQVLNGIQALKASGGEQRAVEQWSGLFNSEINVALARGRLNALIDTLMSGLRQGAPLLILAFGAAQVLAGDLTLGTMLALSALAAGFLEPLSQLVTVGLQAQSIGSYMKRINDVLDTPKEQPGEDVQPAGRLSGHIAAEQVAFGYSADAPPVIDGVSLEILPGQKVAIVGRSGSGKSTLAHLLLGLFTPQRGRILYDGVDLAALEVRSVRQQIGIVTQSSYLFGTTIRENISLANPMLPLSAIERAARIACIHDDIAALPLGYDTFIGDGGVTLSGGQRQRLALARALVNEPKILLLDEATSALDAVTEREVFENLAALDCTIVVIAHRLSTIADADQILLVEQGNIVERGTHDQLLALRSRYQTFVAHQHRPESAALG